MSDGKSQNSWQVERTQVFHFSSVLCILSYLTLLLIQSGLKTSQTELSTATGDPENPQSDSGPSDLDAREDCHSGDNDICVPTPELPPCAAGTGQTGQREYIEPDPLEQEPTKDNPGSVIQLPNLQSTQGFVDALRVASLEKSGMWSETIESLRDPGPVSDLEDPSPLLRLLRHFINNCGSSCAHYKGIWELSCSTTHWMYCTYDF